MDFAAATWLNPLRTAEVGEQLVKITTSPDTDFWQRTYYGFQNDSAPALLLESDRNFSFTTRACFTYQGRFDQCGVAIYIDSNNWFKASVEFEAGQLSRLGSVVTNGGYSDWATVDITTPTSMWYRLNRRGPDFLIESSTNGIAFQQMRIFHLHALGETSAEMGKLDPPAPPEQPVRFGLYACSPLASSFEATFDNFELVDCLWRAHGVE